MTLSALIGGLILIFLSQIQTIGLFYLSWLLLGLTTSGCLYPACFSYLTNVYKDDAKRPIMLVTLLGGFAGTICYPITSYYVELFDWQFAAIFWGLVNIFICAPLFRYSNLEKTFQIQKNVSKNEKLNRLEILKFFKKGHPLPCNSQSTLAHRAPEIAANSSVYRVLCKKSMKNPG